MKKFITFTFLLVLFFLGCSMSPGAHLIRKGEVEIKGEFSAFIGHVNPGIAAIPNLSFNSKYGVTDHFNIGLTCNPFFLLANKTLLLAPQAVVNAVKQNRWVPDFNLYTEISVISNFDNWEVYVLPMVGTALRYNTGRIAPYACAELVFDRGGILDSDVDLHWNVRLGLGTPIKDRWYLNFEAGINDIGARSYITNNTYGFPVVFAGLSYLIKKAETQQ